MVDKTKQFHSKKVVIGISAFYHDSAAALLQGENIVAAAHEERFTRKKHDASFPTEALKYCLSEAKLDINEVDAVVFYDKPFLKLERLLETYLAHAPRGVRSFVSAATVWIKEKFFLRSLIEKELIALGCTKETLPKLLFTEHHLSHAASAFYPSPFKEAAVVTIDGVGEWTTTSIAKGEGSALTALKEIHFPHSIGLLYSAFTYFLGFRVNSGEYKLMGLAPYGRHGSPEVERYKKLIYDNLLTQFEDGSYALNQSFFAYATGVRMIKEKKWEQLFDLKTRRPDDELQQAHCDLGLAIQQVTEELVLKLLKHAKEITQSENLCLAGGVALNCVANRKIVDSGLFKNVWVQPAAGDAGGALGAAQAIQYLYYGEKRTVTTSDSMLGSYLGPEYSDAAIESTLDAYQANYTKLTPETIPQTAATLIADGNVVGWFQGRMEWGPRALGNRSIIADPRNSEMQKKLNLKIKYRESFRPFAPSVLAEYSDTVFDTSDPSPYMLFVADVLKEHQHARPENYDSLALMDRLYHDRSHVPAITHLDYSARLQTVHKETNRPYWELIDAFRELTGVPLVVNTSFNVRGEPIVCTPKDALQCFIAHRNGLSMRRSIPFRKISPNPHYRGSQNLCRRLVKNAPKTLAFLHSCATITNMSNQDDLRADRERKIAELKEKGVNPYPAVTNRTHEIVAVLDNFEDLESSQEAVTIAGRVMAKREHGALAFLDVFDGTAKIQIFCSEEILSPETFNDLTNFTSTGDFVEITGTAFITKRGTQAVKASAWQVLTKAVQNLPTEHFGIKDEDERFRKRYLDLLLKPELRDLFAKKAQFWAVTREFMTRHGFLE